MGKRGPAPKSKQIKDLAGNPGNRPASPAVRLQPGAPDMPVWLSGEAKLEWLRVVPLLEAAGVLSVADQAALAGYCQSVAELRIATEILDAESRIVIEPVQNSRGEVIGQRYSPHPAVRLQRDALAKLRAFMVEFGLSPAARARVSAVSQPAEEVDPLQELINRAC